MAGRAGAGELRTRIFVLDKHAPEARNANGYPVAEPVNVFGEGASRRCKWVNAHGNEVYHAMQAGVEECATLTLRYTPKITTTSVLYREKDPRPYEVISVNDVEDRHRWLEVKVQRREAAR